MTALGPRALVGVALGRRPLCSCSPASRNAGAAPSRRRIGAPHVPASSRAAESRAAGRARRAHGRAVARDPGASWSGDWDATADEAPAYAGGDEDKDADDGLSGMPYGWSEWLNQVRFGVVAPQSALRPALKGRCTALAAPRRRRRMALRNHCVQHKPSVCNARARCSSSQKFGLMPCSCCCPLLFRGRR